MRAVALHYSQRTLDLIDVPMPPEPAPDEALIRVQEGGICGTDRELANFKLGYGPEGSDLLILGHEALGQVVECGSATHLRAGDWVVPMVRRPCSPLCRSCARDRRDLCVSGNYTERGIFGAHGYLTEFVVDAEQNLVAVDAGILDIAVLTEPLSVVEKAVDTLVRLHPGGAETALVLGAGTIGILGALVLQQRGLRVAVHSLEPRSSARVRALEAAGPAYLEKLEGRFDLILEAAGSNEKACEAIGHLGPLGVMMLLGAKESTASLPFLELIVKNQTIAGSVNAGPEHFRQAAKDLRLLPADVLRGLIHREPLERFRDSILGHVSERPKIVHVLE